MLWELYKIQRHRVGHIAQLSYIKMGGTYNHGGALKRQQIIKNKNSKLNCCAFCAHLPYYPPTPTPTPQYPNGSMMSCCISIFIVMEKAN